MQADASYLRGLDVLRQVEGTAQPATLGALDDVAPDLARLAERFVYGEIYSRPGLALRERQMVTVAALAALGNAAPQLRFHLRGALNVGCTPTEVVEALVHIAIYAGFPASLNALLAAKDVFAQQGLKFEPAEVPPAASRHAAGWQALQRIDGHAGERVIESLKDIAPDLARFVIEFSFGDIYTRPGLGLVEREIVTVAALAALGTATPQLKVHVHGLLNVGGTREQLVEIVLQISAYAGFPAAINAALAAKEVLAERQGA
ncbi:MAG TPA: carboxymuconolactone decarboxylase family protein [Burkholderiaceae bacterium]|jgi:4-carboxymuconolactone decarboxylase|nr:carboxymuconolactone decarboxylase family protein [Burkholderiaceae bacterium]